MYNRKKHLWNFRDILRIVRTSRNPLCVVSIDNELFNEFTKKITENFYQATEGDLFTFSGGEFGGAGVSRTWIDDAPAATSECLASEMESAEILVIIRNTIIPVEE